MLLHILLNKTFQNSLDSLSNLNFSQLDVIKYHTKYRNNSVVDSSLIKLVYQRKVIFLIKMIKKKEGDVQFRILGAILAIQRAFLQEYPLLSFDTYLNYILKEIFQMVVGAMVLFLELLPPARVLGPFCPVLFLLEGGYAVLRRIIFFLLPPSPPRVGKGVLTNSSDSNMRSAIQG